MVYLLVMTYYVAWTGAILGAGVALERRLWPGHDGPAGETVLKREMRLPLWGCLGFGLFAFASTVISFFFAVSSLVVHACMTAGLLLLWTNRRRAFFWLARGDLAIVGILLAYSCLMPFVRNDIVGDLGGYHFPFVKWTCEQALPLGLANVHSRFGFNSSWFAVAALLEQPSIVYHANHYVTNAIVMFFYGSGVLLGLKSLLRGDRSPSSMFLASTVLPWSVTVCWAVNSFSPDLPTMLITFLVVLLIVRALESSDSAYPYLEYAVVISAFVLTIKLSTLPLLPLSGLLLIIKRRPIISRSQAVTALLCGFVLVPWLARGVWLSGCLLFPSAASCLGGLDWTVPLEQVREMEAWVKGWARVPTAEGALASISQWNWIGPWFVRVKRDLAPVSALVGLGLLLFVASRWQKTSGPHSVLPFVVPAGMCAVGIGFWFVSAPDPRFAYGFLYSFALLLVCAGLAASDVLAEVVNRCGRHGNIPMTALCAITCLLVVFFLRHRVLEALCWAAACTVVISLLITRIDLRNLAIYTLALVLLTNGCVFQFAIRQGDLFELRRVPGVTVNLRNTHQGVTVRVPNPCCDCWHTTKPCSPNFDARMVTEVSKEGTYVKFRMPK